jgi:tRNA A-37 threonylcarbamoyl transferase component Bud32
LAAQERLGTPLPRSVNRHGTVLATGQADRKSHSLPNQNATKPAFSIAFLSFSATIPSANLFRLRQFGFGFSMQKFGRYEILTELGRGGMATVYLAHDPAFDRHVAIKVLPARFTHDPQFRARFMREAKVIAALEHPFIVPVYDFGEEGENPFIVMRHMPGGTLGDRLANGPMALADVVPILVRMADALDEAHRNSIVHRDLKPTNILFDLRGDSFLSDFGLAKLSESSTKLTFTGVMVGTPDYMSPEQAIGDEEADRRSDVYSLGVILFEMLSGSLPYTASTPMKIMYKHLNEPVPKLDTARLGLPVVTNLVLSRAMAKKLDDRYPAAGALATAVSALQTGAPSSALAPAAAIPLSPQAAATLRPFELPSAMPKSTAPSAAARPGDGRPAGTRPMRAASSRPWLVGGGIVGGIVILALLGTLVAWGGGFFASPTPTVAATATFTPTVMDTATSLPGDALSHLHPDRHRNSHADADGHARAAHGDGDAACCGSAARESPAFADTNFAPTVPRTRRKRLMRIHTAAQPLRCR